ncbi:MULTISPECIES: hypothetical protein [Geobacillus thermoleovorans group]|uniref:Uncharacterized protein n=1 Tax=Geobacillus kaustophilus (strain HTA426) TaxID=235909 RepID=Q5L231_GEOKA|nr:hypothetical protein [Geobacillus kaustophilus]BAD74999.1 hypothetical protein GK0714 [Geobacillus kaustophilus HTA426]
MCQVDIYDEKYGESRGGLSFLAVHLAQDRKFRGNDGPQHLVSELKHDVFPKYEGGDDE